MTTQEIMNQLEAWGSEQTKKVLKRHGATEPFYGVKVADMKKIVKKVKKDHELSLSLYDTGNSDAMYLAGLIADENKMTPEILDKWAQAATWYFVSDYAVAAVTSESPYGMEMGLKWIEDEAEFVQSAGWSTLAAVMSHKPNDTLDIPKFESLIDRVVETIHDSKNRVRYAMNGFVLAAGSYIPELTDKAIEAGKAIGKVQVNMGETACKVPDIQQYIKKLQDKDYIGKKRKVARC